MFVPKFLGGPLFGRRFTPQALPLDADREDYFFYCALQAVSAGLTERVSEYPGYNSFKTAIGQRSEKTRLFKYGAYNAAKRFNPQLPRKDFYEEHVLTYSKLPHLEHLNDQQYRNYLLAELEQRRIEIVAKRKAEGKGFVGRERLLEFEPGSLPANTKKGGRRPLVLSSCSEARRLFLESYFSSVVRHRDSSLRYRQGEFDVEFPPGTYRPPGICMLR